LTEGNVRQTDAPLAEAQSLLATLSEAWYGVRKSKSACGGAPAGPAPQASAWMDSDAAGAHVWSA